MNQYPEELKASVIARMLPPNNASVPELVRETSIPKDTSKRVLKTKTGSKRKRGQF
jgi:hypothetical protein